MTAIIRSIYTAVESGQPMQSVNSAQLVAGQGITGDRYCSGKGTFSAKLKDMPDRELTLIEFEEIELFNTSHAFSFDAGDFRRNIVTRGIRLNELVDREFSIGGVRLRGIRLCEPCNHLAKLTSPEILRALVHKAGLRAAILNSGEITVNDTITP